ncbi:MAG: FlgO family outer membrane protein [Actinomycetota bacterium]
MRTLLTAAVMMATAATARADGYRTMARELASQAKRAGVMRVAVLPFEPADGGSPRDGWNISEKLVTQLVRTGKVQALERSMLRALLSEQRLGQTGALDPATLKRIGRVLSADGIVTGSFTTIGREVEVNARLINTETGVIVAASERRAGRDWFDLPNLFVPAPEFSVAAPEIVEEGESAFAMRDALTDEGCDDAAARVDRLENDILDIKARYWALRLKKGLDLASLKTNPGSTITDPELKQQFYDRMNAWYAQPRVPPLDAAETKRLVAVDGQAHALHKQCRL